MTTQWGEQAAQHMNEKMLRATRPFNDIRVLSPKGDVTARVAFKIVPAFRHGSLLDGKLRALKALTDPASGVAPQLSYIQCTSEDAYIEPLDISGSYQKSDIAIR